MSTVEFDEWATPTLDLRYGGRTYSVRPPTVDQAPLILQAARLSVHALANKPGGCVFCGRSCTHGQPETVQDIVAAIGDRDVADIPLTPPVHAQMVTDGVPAADIDRMSTYAVWYWASGKRHADALAKVNFGHAGGADPKAAPRSPQKSGRPTGSGSPTRKAGTPGTGNSPRT